MDLIRGQVKPETLLAGLNDRQREAVSAEPGPVLVLAGPGSGKTRVLTHRVAWLVGVMGVAPWHIMAVTFTNKAAREMAERLESLIGREALGRLTIGTFHAICARILRQEAQGLGFDRRFVIFDADDQQKTVRKAIAELNLDDKTYRPGAVLGAISSAKNELIRPSSYTAQTYWHEVAGRVYKAYQDRLRAQNALDFDDLLLETACLMRDDAAVRARYQERYPFLLVDEFQDTNSAQYALLKALAASELPEAPHNLFVVGDEDQSIYRWRGADYRNLMRFRQDFPAARVVLLEQNYRSTQTILDAAQAVIDHNPQRTHKKLWTDAGPGSGVTLFEAYDGDEEAAYIVREIERRVGRGDSYGDFAVMYRTNAQSRLIEDAFVRWSVPYQLVGATRFYDRREVRDVLAYLRFIHNPQDEIALERIINVPPRNVGPKAWAILVEVARALGATLWEAADLIAGEADLPGMPAVDTRSRKALAGFHAVMADLMAAADHLAAPELLDQVLEGSGYARWLRDGTEEGEERWENVAELRGVAADFAGQAPREGLAAMLESVALVSDIDSLSAEARARVTLLTLHAAKGLEFEHVFISGLEEGILPHSRSKDDAEALAEERRLFYVGVTRARRALTLTHAFRRALYGASEPAERSRFLDELPPMVFDGSSGGAPRSRSAARSTATARQTAWPVQRQERESPAGAGAAPRGAGGAGGGGGAVGGGTGRGAGAGGTAGAAGAASPAAAFKPGDKVRHGHFGEGVVVSSIPRDGDEEVTVAFTDGGAGIKKLMQRFAKLERR